MTDLAARELIAYIRSLFPMRFYQGEHWWSVYAAAATARLADLGDAVLCQLPDRRDLDASATLAEMYELSVTLAWVLIDPDGHRAQWEGEAFVSELELHDGLTELGMTMLGPDELVRARSAKAADIALPALHERAQAADAEWGTLADDPALLSFSDLFIGVRRAGSRSTHGSFGSLLPYIAEEEARYVVGPAQTEDSLLTYELVSTILAVTLIVLDSKVMWIDEEKVRALARQ